ncbi:PAS domain-containing sensor histidine kinase [bacterium]|nr:PAS domain-containing sensor histidine kinase [bacterium]
MHCTKGEDVITIGSIIIEDSLALTEKRVRIIRLAEDLGFSTITATRLATAVSEIINRALEKNSAAVLSALIGENGEDSSFIFEIKSRKLNSSNYSDNILSILDKVEEYIDQQGFRVFRGFRTIPGTKDFSDKGFIDKLKNDFTSLTNDEARNIAESAHKKLKSVFDSATHISIISTDVDGVITLINSGTVRMLGYNQSDLTGKIMVSNLFIEHELEARSIDFFRETGHFVKGFELFTERIRRYDQDDWECTYVKKDGSQIIVNQIGTAIRNNEGWITGYLFVSQDITRRKEAEQEVLRLASVVKQAKNTIVLTDLDGNIVYANPFFEKTSGYTVKEALGENPRVLKSGIQDDAFYKDLWDTITRGKAWNGVFINKRKDGSLYHEEATIFPIINNKGQIINYAAVKQDVTKRVEAENALKESEENLSSITSSAQDAIIMIDENSRITFWNPAAERIFGYQSTEALGEDIINLIIMSKYRSVFRTGINRFKDKKAELIDERVTEIQGVRKDGDVFPASLSFSSVMIKGMWNGVGIVRDITKQKQAEEALRQNMESLKESNEEIKRFAYIVSHDLRAPLVNLKGFSRELKRGIEVLDPIIKAAIETLDEKSSREIKFAYEEDIPEALEFIEASVEKMDRFISSILTLSRIGRRELTWRKVNIKAVVDEIVKTLSHQITEKNITVKTKNLVKITADKTSIEQIFGNLLDNAVKFMDTDKPGLIEILHEEDSKFHKFSICDNGRGIAEKDMEKVFAIFRRAGKQDKPGEGMGMAYVQTLVKRHGGIIRVESKLGQGTTFFFTISKNPDKSGDLTGV